MQSQLEEHPNFKLKYKYNPIETLEAIKTMIHDLAIAQWPMFSMIESTRRLIKICSYENENFLDYVKEFKQALDVVKFKAGTLDNFVTNQEENWTCNNQNEQ